MSVFTWFNGTYSSKQVRQLLGAVMWKRSTSRPLGARSGISSGIGSSILTVSSTTWTLTPFTGVLDLETDATQGPAPFVVDANLTGSVTAANASNDRIDLLSLTMDDASATVPHVVYTTGTAAASPSVPATPANSIALAQITVPQSGHGSPSFAWVAPTFTVGAPKACGTVTLACGAATVTTQAVTFPIGLFLSTPVIALTQYGANPQNFQAGVTGDSSTGFTLNVYSATATNRTIGWQAMIGDA